MYHHRQWKMFKAGLIFGEIILLVSIILTFFLLYEVLVQNNIPTTGRWAVYLFIVFLSEIVALLFGYIKFDPIAHTAKLLFVVVAFIFALLLLIAIKNLNLPSNVALGIAITIAVLIGVLLIMCFIGIFVAWKISRLKRVYMCKRIEEEEAEEELRELKHHREHEHEELEYEEPRHHHYHHEEEIETPLRRKRFVKSARY
jgi:Na+-transporting methylmalonyl-CoA/oxaloacetate decarboxylase gamma subunit